MQSSLTHLAQRVVTVLWGAGLVDSVSWSGCPGWSRNQLDMLTWHLSGYWDSRRVWWFKYAERERLRAGEEVSIYSMLTLPGPQLVLYTTSSEFYRSSTK